MAELTGIARNAMAGAVIVADDGRVVYIENLAEWPDDVLGKEVAAEGDLSTEKLIPDPAVGEDGAVSAGAEGVQLVLKDAKWRPVSG